MERWLARRRVGACSRWEWTWAAEPTYTAVARISLDGQLRQLQIVGLGADDPVLVQITASDKAGIDCPMGRPQRFVEWLPVVTLSGGLSYVPGSPPEAVGCDRLTVG